MANVNGLVFTRDDGRAINKDIITQAVRVARKRAGVADFPFHDYRHSAIHQRYVDLNPADVARAFGICSNGVQTNPADKSAVSVGG